MTCTGVEFCLCRLGKQMQPSSDQSSRVVRRVHWMYFLALTLIALLTLTGHGLMQRSLASREDASVINLAGRQRMLSQRIALTGLEIERQLVLQREEAPQLADEMAVLLEDFVVSHADLVLPIGHREELLHGDETLQALFAELEPARVRLREESEALIEMARRHNENRSPEAAEHLRREIMRRSEALADAAHEFLPRMDQIVTRYETLAQAHRSALARLDLVVLLVTLVVLLAEAVLIFRPALRLIRSQLDMLTNTSIKAHEGERSKAEFLANMSHEIRTPMTSIVGYAEVLADSELPEAERARHLSTIRRAGTHLLELIDDILDLSKIQAEQMQTQRERISPLEVLWDVHSLCSMRAAQQGLTFDLRFNSAIPRTVTADPARLRQVLINLVGNAVKFTQAGEVSIHVCFEHADTRKLVIEVRDTGIGIEPDRLDEIFEPFTQADNSVTRRFGGTGLGLTICATLAEAMGCALTAASTLGEGSIFRLSMPVSECEASDLIHPDTTGPVQSTPESVDTPDLVILRGARILLADDAPENRRLLSYFLEKAGAEVVLAEDGQAAVAAWQERVQAGQAIDLIMLDMQMPVLDGYAAAGEFRRLGATAPICALTADTMEGDREKCLRAGCDGYLSKPVSRGALLGTCAAAIRAARARRAA